MKKIIFLSIFLLLASSVIAQGDVDEGVGITPDSPLYGLEKAFKRISLALTFNQQKKAEKELKYSRERLREMRLMIERKKVEAAEKALEGHEELLERARERIHKLEDLEGLENNLELETELEEQENEIGDIDLGSEVLELNLEQRERVRNLVDKLKIKNQELRQKVELKKEALRLRLKEKGVSEVEIEEKIQDKENEGLKRAFENRVENVEKQIERSEEFFEDREDKSGLNDLEIAKERLKLAKGEFEVGNAEEAKNLINEALRLAVLVRGSEKVEKAREMLRERKQVAEKVKEELQEKRVREQEQLGKRE